LNALGHVSFSVLVTRAAPTTPTIPTIPTTPTTSPAADGRPERTSPEPMMRWVPQHFV
jgi:hypothetical protein